jgi:hypothetical protein
VLLELVLLMPDDPLVLLELLVESSRSPPQASSGALITPAVPASHNSARRRFSRVAMSLARPSG